MRHLSFGLVLFLLFILQGFADNNPFSLIKDSSAKGIEHIFYNEQGEFQFLFVGYDLKFIGDSDDVIFACPKLTFDQEKDNPHIIAKQAIWRSKIDKIEISGNVIAFSEEGYQFNTERVDMFRKSQKLEFPQSFIGYYDSLKLNASQGDYDMTGKVLETQGNTLCRYQLEKSEGKAQEAKEIIVRCQKGLRFNSTDQKVLFRGSVDLRQGSLWIQCDSLQITFNKVNGKNDIVRLLAMGKVKIVDPSQDLIIHCDRADYDRKRDYAVFFAKEQATIQSQAGVLKSAEVHLENSRQFLTTIGHTEVTFDTVSTNQAPTKAIQDKVKKEAQKAGVGFWVSCENGMMVNMANKSIRFRDQVVMKQADFTSNCDNLYVTYQEKNGEHVISSFEGKGNVVSEQGSGQLKIESDSFALDTIKQDLKFNDSQEIKALLDGSELYTKELLYNLRTKMVLSQTKTKLIAYQNKSEELKKQKKPMVIHSQKGLRYDPEKGTCRFNENVQLKMHDLDLDCDELDIKFVPIQGRNEIKFAGGQGNVHCTQKARGLDIKSDRFQYDFKTEEIEFFRESQVLALIQNHRLMSKTLRYQPQKGQLFTYGDTLAKLKVPSQETKPNEKKMNTMHITSQGGMVMDENKKHVIFRRKVKMLQEDFELNCDTLKADYEEGKNQEMEIKDVQGYGNVVCLKPSRQLDIQSEKFNYDYMQGNIIFESIKTWVNAKMDGHHLVGRKILYNQTTEKIKTLGKTQMEFIGSKNEKIKKHQKEKIFVTCEEGLQMFPTEKRVEFNKNVDLKDGESRLQCQTLNVYYLEKNGNKEIEKALGQGEVVLHMIIENTKEGPNKGKKETFDAECEKLVYDYKKENVVLTRLGGIEARYGNQTLICDRFEVNMKSGDWLASGNIDGEINFDDLQK